MEKHNPLNSHSHNGFEIRNNSGGQKKEPLLNRIYRFDSRHGSKMLKFTAKSVFKIFEYLYALAYIPFIQKRIPALDPEQSDMSWIPINKNIEGAEGIALPEEVVDRLIDLSNYRVVIDFCACRKVYTCKNYPEEIGCIFMGESAKKISKNISREVTREEAKGHLRRAIAAGLVPIVGEARADHDLLRIPPNGTLLTCCFCCECCCLSRFFKRGPADVIHGIMEPVEGLSIEITEDCVGCGACVKKCFVEAIEIKEGRAVMSEYCTLCGRCAGVCPENAIKLKLNNPNAVDDVIKRITGRIDLS